MTLWLVEKERESRKKVSCETGKDVHNATLLLIIRQMRESLIQLHTHIQVRLAGFIPRGIFLIYAAIEKNRR